MFTRCIATPLAVLLLGAGCAGAAQTRSTTTAARTCSLDTPHASGDAFDAPLTVLRTSPTYRTWGRTGLHMPAGVEVSVRAEPGLSAPFIHRMIACRLPAEVGPARISVRPYGPTYRVVLSSDEPSTARELQERYVGG